jgi:exosortase/archaeosortase family protein
VRDVWLIIKGQSSTVIKLLPIIAFVVPLAMLYFLNPVDPFLKLSGRESFELMWKGRTFQLFFVWLVALEFILGWDNIKLNIFKQNKPKILAIAIALLLPTLYIAFTNYFGLNAVIAKIAMQTGIAFWDSMPLATEYLIFTALFSIIVFLSYGKKGLTSFALPVFFLGLVGGLYTIDNIFPYGQFTPFQLLVPTTAMLAANVLSFMGYGTNLQMIDSSAGIMPYLQATGPAGTTRFAIAWPCAGIESLLIFTVVAILFLKRMQLSWRTKIGLFTLGATITYFINILRIVTIFIIGMQYGASSSQVHMFHFYYGPLYSIVWIVSYPMIILTSQGLWQKLRARKPALTIEP